MQVKQTIAGWLHIGRTLVFTGVDSVEIIDRSPLHDTDRLSPEGAYFWQYGWRWLAPDEPCSAWTLPQAIFQSLPPCPHDEVESERREGHGVCPRWPTAEAATQALQAACLAWARAKPASS